MKTSRLLLIAGAAAFALCVACGRVSEPPPVFATSDNATVIIEGFAFTPPVLKVPQGTNVTWINKYPVAHRINSEGASPNFTSPNLNTGGTFSWTFDQTGNYTYYCGLHPSMKGKIVVIVLK